MSQYQLISQIIQYIYENSNKNITLEDLSEYSKLSPDYIQKMFIQWCGISPKQFQRFLTLEHAKNLLKENNTTFKTALNSGLSGGGRLHDLFVDIESMTPGEYKNHGQNLIINYSIHESQFGYYVIGSIEIGVCRSVFGNSR